MNRTEQRKAAKLLAMCQIDTLVELSTLDTEQITNKQHLQNQFLLHLGELSAYLSSFESLKGSPPPQITVTLAVYRRLTRAAQSYRITFFGVPIVTLAKAPEVIFPEPETTH